MSRMGALIAAGTVVLLAGGCAKSVPSTAASSPPPAAAPQSWHIALTVPVKNNADLQFTAVVATGKTTGWAFDGFDTRGGETAWQRTGNGWKQVTFPGKNSEFIATAAATSPSDVWAFGDDISGNTSRALRWTGSKWVVVRTFGGDVLGATVLGASDVWVFGTAPEQGATSIGVWHFDGSAWTRVGANIGGGSALSDHDVWGFNDKNVEHYDGHTWQATSVKSLLPAVQRGGLNNPQVVGILALSDTDVYALGSSDAQDEGGPVVVLHFNGRSWSRVAEGQYGYGPGQDFSSDGHGGLWLPMDGPFGGTSYLVHYANGKLSKASVPVNPANLTVSYVARIPGTTEQLAGGYKHPPGDRTPAAAVILQYS